MKATDLVLHLHRELPKYTTRFSTEIITSSVTVLGNTVTVVTPNNHNLLENEIITVTDTLIANPVVVISTAGNIRTVNVSNPHDFTKNYPNQTARISGANESGYNGTFPVVDVIDRISFTIKMDSPPPIPATGTIILEEYPVNSYNNLFNVHVIDQNTFSYTVPSTFPGVPVNTKIYSKTRISSAITIERAQDSYTKMSRNEFWGFIILGGTRSSVSREQENDTVNIYNFGDDKFTRIIQDVTLYVFVSTGLEDTVGASTVKDDMEDLVPILFKSILNFKPVSQFTVNNSYGLVFVNHGILEYNNGNYVHQFNFECTTQLSASDMHSNNMNVSINTINMNFINTVTDDESNVIITSKIDL